MNDETRVPTANGMGGPLNTAPAGRGRPGPGRRGGASMWTTCCPALPYQQRSKGHWFPTGMPRRPKTPGDGRAFCWQKGRAGGQPRWAASTGATVLADAGISTFTHMCCCWTAWTATTATERRSFSKPGNRARRPAATVHPPPLVVLMKRRGMFRKDPVTNEEEHLDAPPAYGQVALTPGKGERSVRRLPS